ncbi:MAG: trypsin-like peptidase domain-containing protein [Planctomycetota bacterium]
MHRSRLLVFTLVLCSAFATATPTMGFGSESVQAAIRHTVDRARPASISVSDGMGSFSAVIVSSDGIVLTAGHCVEPGARYEILLPDGRTYSGIGLGREMRVDLGMIRIDNAGDEELPWVELGRSGELNPGELAIGISYPGPSDPSLGPIVRVGKITKRRSRGGFVESTVLMEPGDSGGGLFDSAGRLIGIHSQIDAALDANYDVPIDRFVEHWPRLLAGNEFSIWREQTENLGFEVEASQDGRLAVSQITDDSAAARSGLLVGDQILRAGDDVLERESDLARAFRRAARSGRKRVRLIVDRNETALGVTYRFDVPKVVGSTTPKTFSPPGRSWKEPTPIGEFASAVRIESQLNGTKSAILGTRVHGLTDDSPAFVVSKSSRVGSSPVIRSGSGESLPATIVARDPSLDLVLLSGIPREIAARNDSVDEVTTGRQVGAVQNDGSVLWGVVGSPSRPVPAELMLGVRIAERAGEEVVIEEVFPDSAAASAGLEAGDRILRIAHTEVRRRTDLTGALSALLTPREISIQVQREGRTETVRATPKERDSGQSYHVADAVPGGLSQRRNGFASAFPFDAHLTPEQCGAPLVDGSGQLVAIAIARRSRTQCLGLPIAAVREFVQRALSQPRIEDL